MTATVLVAAPAQAGSDHWVPFPPQAQPIPDRVTVTPSTVSVGQEVTVLATCKQTRYAQPAGEEWKSEVNWAAAVPQMLIEDMLPRAPFSTTSVDRWVETPAIDSGRVEYASYSEGEIDNATFTPNRSGVFPVTYFEKVTTTHPDGNQTSAVTSCPGPALTVR
ncbi:hypothetical protein [Nocardia colli]|uniref:hypothetical protein n=1 Tax=Nocardia colli TaxID=2545717 RepID=UPI0035D6ABEE